MLFRSTFSCMFQKLITAQNLIIIKVIIRGMNDHKIQVTNTRDAYCTTTTNSNYKALISKNLESATNHIFHHPIKNKKEFHVLSYDILRIT